VNHRPLQDQVSSTSLATQGTRESPQVGCETDPESSVLTADQMTPAAQQAKQCVDSIKHSVSNNTISTVSTSSQNSSKVNIDYANEPCKHCLMDKK